MIPFNERALKAVVTAEELQGMPIETMLARANKALAEKQWPTAALLFQEVSLKAIILASHCFEQEVKLIKGET